MLKRTPGDEHPAENAASVRAPGASERLRQEGVPLRLGIGAHGEDEVAGVVEEPEHGRADERLGDGTGREGRELGDGGCARLLPIRRGEGDGDRVEKGDERVLLGLGLEWVREGPFSVPHLASSPGVA